MGIRFKCPNCQVEYDVEEEYAGITTKCPNCHKEITVPELPKQNDKKSAKKK